MSNTTAHLKITVEQVAARLKLEFDPKEQGWRNQPETHGAAVVPQEDGPESVVIEVYAPRTRGSWYSITPKAEDHLWGRAEIRISGHRFRRSKARAGDFDWAEIERVVRSTAEGQMWQKRNGNERSRLLKHNEPHVVALLEEFTKVSEYEVHASRSEEDIVDIRLGTVSVSPAVARIILSALRKQ